MPFAIPKNALTRALFAILLSSGPGAAPAHAGPGELVYIGSQANQIRAARFDATSGALSMIGAAAEGLRPTWIAAHSQLPVLYAVNDERAKPGKVIAFAIDRQSGALAKINDTGTGGEGSTNFSVDAAAKTMLVANFTGGSVSSIALKPDGSLGPLVSTIAATGSGPHRRQTSAHAHGVTLDPSGRYALVADLGADRLFVYGFDGASKTLAADEAAKPRSITLPPGSGPRHLAFGPDGRFVYLLTEMSADLVTLRWDAQQGGLAVVQSLYIGTPEFKEAKSGSEVIVSADGRFVYAGNRAEHQLLVYRIHAQSGELTLVQRTSSGGELPWNFALHSSGKWMLVANQRSNKVNVFRVDTATGILTDSGQALEMTSPVAITFVK
jgi:6-phosphogluconolactonase